MRSKENASEVNYDDLLGDVPRVESITANYGFIPESWFIWRRRSGDRKRNATT